MIYDVIFSTMNGGQECKLEIFRDFGIENYMEDLNLSNKINITHVDVYDYVIDSNNVEIKVVIQRRTIDPHDPNEPTRDNCINIVEYVREVLDGFRREHFNKEIYNKLFNAFNACSSSLNYAFEVGCGGEQPFINYIIKQFNDNCYGINYSQQMRFLEKSENENLDAHKHRYNAGHLHKIEVKIGNNEKDCTKLINYYSLNG